jgi:ABC-type phosphate transport system substrate-binding protein
MRIRSALTPTLAVAILSLSGSLRARAPAPDYEMIVTSGQPEGAVDRVFLADAFLKKVTTWPDGNLIRPVDQTAGSPTRKSFTEDVLRRSVEAVKSYWQQRIFAGRDVPPPELDGNDEVVAYVAKHPGAVGYVATGTVLSGAKVLAVK